MADPTNIIPMEMAMDSELLRNTVEIINAMVTIRISCTLWYP